MNKIMTALAVLAVIAAGTLAAVVQQLQPEEYPTVDAVISQCSGKNSRVIDKLTAGDNHIAVIYREENDSYAFLDIRSARNGYILKEETVRSGDPYGLSVTFKYSKKETATVSLLPDEQGVLRCSLTHVEG